MSQANYFRVRRFQLGLTQRAIAESLGITDAAVGMWERGATLPSLHLVPKLATVYRVSEDKLLRVMLDLSRDPVAA